MDISFIKHLCQLSLSSDYTDNKDTRQGDENATIVYDNDFDRNADEEYDDDADDDESDSHFQEFDVESGSEEEERPPQVLSVVTPCVSLGHLLRVRVYHCANTLHIRSKQPTPELFPM